MPVPASDPADALQTPEVFSQNELYGRYDSRGKMDGDESFGLDFLANIGIETTPRGSNVGADTSFKLHPEPASDVNLDAKESFTSFDDLLNSDLLNGDLFDDALPLSSQEMNNLCHPVDVNDVDYSRIKESIEEQNGEPQPSFINWPGSDICRKVTPAVAPAKPSMDMDRYSQFAVAPVNTTITRTSATREETKPDIVQHALYQSESFDLNDATFTAEDLAGATIVMVSEEAFDRFVTIDSSAMSQIGNRNVDVGGDESALTIPLTVQRAAEPEASTSASVFENDAASTTPYDFTKLEGAGIDDATVSRSLAAPSTSSPGAKKRKAASSVADDDDWTADGDNLDYKEKRRRNNIAVRKSRAVAKEKQKNVEAENEKLKEDNEKKSREIEILQREIKIYKELFDRSGFSLPRK